MIWVTRLYKQNLAYYAKNEGNIEIDTGSEVLTIEDLYLLLSKNNDDGSNDNLLDKECWFYNGHFCIGNEKSYKLAE